MKRLALLLFLLPGCTLFNVQRPTTPEAPKVDLVARLVNATVALAAKETKDVFCSGVAAEGAFMTAAHCVGEDAPTPFVVRYQGAWYEGAVVFVDEEHDFALIDAIGARIKDELPVTTWEAVVGQKVVWFGWPAGLEQYMGTGIVANPHSSAEWAKGFIAVYGQFIGGNSGGPVVDETGALMGLVSSTLVVGFQSVPIGYVIPTQVIRDALATH